jgi:glycosyltransferase involved in cell wall biosynthesis
MGYGNCVLALAAPENVEVVGEAGIPYRDENELAEQLQRVLRDASLVASYRQLAQDRVRHFYNWESVVDRYERLFAEIGGRHVSQSFDPLTEKFTVYDETAAKKG